MQNYPYFAVSILIPCTSSFATYSLQHLSQATDSFELNRETAIIALSFCDRFLLYRQINKHLFQIAAMASLFIASKLYEKRPIKMAAMMKFTQYKFEREDVIVMEEQITNSIGTYMYPPTAGVRLTSSFTLISHAKLHSSPSLTSTVPLSIPDFLTNVPKWAEGIPTSCIISN